jgi:hypothetical protein
MPTFWANLLIGIVIAVVSAITTVFLAFQRFRREKWWERKADAYSRIIEALHLMKRGLEDDLEHIQGDRRPDEEPSDEAIHEFRRAEAEVHKAIDTGSFLLSQDAQNAMEQLKTDLSHAGRPAGIGALGVEIDALGGCLEKLPDIAKRDLGTG